MLEIEIDGKKLNVPDGSTIMDAANMLGTYVPHFCYHKKLSIAANCRMCLVQVEKAPKPLPACATPVTDGMKVWTSSESAVKAQKGVMEFLLINHPLDCPICDQGGECQLQDLAVGYGGSSSRYDEPKRVVINKNLGPLISTDMTRCIHCTRCVRFGQEVADVMELGMAGRGEHSEIMPFVERTVDSEMSGNVIDLCPVGALTSKPFRYAARSWELARRKSVSPHDGLGSNLVVQVKQNKVLRVLPQDNEDVNECWLSDRDRFSYEALNLDSRLTKPLKRTDSGYREIEWKDALQLVADGLSQVKSKSGADQIAVLATPSATLEELSLLKKIAKGLGTDNIDYRIRQSDFRGDRLQQGAEWLGMSVRALQSLPNALVIGGNLRKEHPLLAHRLRQLVKSRNDLSVIQCSDDDWLSPLTGKVTVAPGNLLAVVSRLALLLAEKKSAEVSPVVAGWATAAADSALEAIAVSLAAREGGGVFLGSIAQHHPDASLIRFAAQEIARLCGAKLGLFSESANTLGAQLLGFVPGDTGNALRVVQQPKKAYVLFGLEPSSDVYDAAATNAALQSADFVVAFSSFKDWQGSRADVILPLAPFTETDGTFINTEGRVQSFVSIVQSLGESKAGWKILTVLGNSLGLPGFAAESAEDIARQALTEIGDVSARLNNLLQGPPQGQAQSFNGLQRLGEFPLYHVDAITRRAPSLQKTRDGKRAAVAANTQTLQELGLNVGDKVSVGWDGGSFEAIVALDAAAPAQTVRIPAGLGQATGPLFGSVKLSKVGG